MKRLPLRMMVRFVLVLMLGTIMIALVVAYFVPLKLQIMSAKQTHAGPLGLAMAQAAQPQDIFGTALVLQDA